MGRGPDGDEAPARSTSATTTAPVGRPVPRTYRGGCVAGTDAATFFGQETAALTRLANDFARSVVSAMLEAF